MDGEDIISSLSFNGDIKNNENQLYFYKRVKINKDVKRLAAVVAEVRIDHHLFKEWGIDL